jgi:hypothetical protein
VDTLECICTDDDVGNGSAVLKNEDGAIAASIGIRVAWLAPVKLSVAKVDTASNDAGLRERHDATCARGNVESLRSRHAGDKREECDLRQHD